MSIYFTLLFLLIQMLLFGQAKSLQKTKPNIIFIMTDDQGLGDFSFSGNKVVKTPNIDTFYAKAMRFSNYHVSPTCSPTRAAIMSGVHEFKTGVTHTIFQRERLSLDVFTLAEMFKAVGYTTSLFGKWHLGDDLAYLPQNRGFDEVLMHGAGGIGQVGLGDFLPNADNLYFDNILLHNKVIVQTSGFCTDVFFNAAWEWTQKQVEAKQPFFTYLSLNAPHAPLVAPETYKKRFLELGYDEGTAGRYGMIENIDFNFGKLMKKLEETGELENTLIIFTTDNGATHLGGTLNGEKVRHFNANLKGAKNSPYEGGTHVPMLWYWKGTLQESVDLTQLTAHIDLYPTFVEITGATLPKEMQILEGNSLLPLLNNDKNTEWPQRLLFTHCGRWPTDKLEEFKYKKMAVQNELWKLVEDDQLYNIANDQGERKNKFAEHPEIVMELKTAYNLWWASLPPFLINENLPRVKNNPLARMYEKQKKKTGIPKWNPKPL